MTTVKLVLKIIPDVNTGFVKILMIYTPYGKYKIGECAGNSSHDGDQQKIPR